MTGTGDKLLTAAEIKEVTDTKLNISDVVNALNSTSTNKPLSAAQGKNLNDAKVNKTDTIAIEHGGTNATSATNARANLDVYSKSEVDTAITQSTADAITPQVVSGASIVSTYSSGSWLTAYRVGKLVIVGGYINASVPAYADVIEGLPKPVSNVYRFVINPNGAFYFNEINDNKVRTTESITGPNFAFVYVTSE